MSDPCSASQNDWVICVQYTEGLDLSHPIPTRAEVGIAAMKFTGGSSAVVSNPSFKNKKFFLRICANFTYESESVPDQIKKNQNVSLKEVIKNE